MVVLAELQVEQCVRAFQAASCNVAHGNGRTASLLELIDKVDVEDALAGVDERLDVVRRELGGHARVRVVLGTLDDVPVDSLKRCAEVEQPPKVLARFVTVIGNVGVVAVLVKPNGEIGSLVLVLERQRVHLDLPPCDEQRTEVALSVLSRVVLFLKEVARAVGCALVDYER